jgi:hypothetical protein
VLSVGGDGLHFRVPFGAGTGQLSVRRANLEASAAVQLRTSISGSVDLAQTQPDGSINRTGATDLLVRLRSNPTFQQLTGSDGSYILPDVPAGDQEVEIVPRQSPLPYPARRFKVSVRSGYDNPASRVELAANGVTPGPGGLTLTLVSAGRTPADLPIGHFSTQIAQLTPFGAAIAGAKLTFANTDAIPAGTLATLFYLDQTPGSPTVGRFIPIGTAKVTADGQSVETANNAITQGSYYFVSISRPLCTISGRVVENDGRPVPRAVVQARGQSVLTDGFGGFVLPNVPLLKDTGDRVRVEVSYLRPDGSISRKDSSDVELRANTLITISPEIVIPPLVIKAATTTTVALINNPSVYGQTVTFSATVMLSPPGAGSIQGNISFYDGTTLLGSVVAANGTASLTTAALDVGSHVISAVYAGSSQYRGSTSPSINQIVNKAVTTIGVISQRNPSSFGQQVTLDATVSVVAPGSGKPTGSIQFFAGPASLGTATLSDGKASITTSLLAVGTASITAAYSGNGSFNGSNSSVLSQTVTKGSATITVSSLNNPSFIGQQVTLKAVVNAVSPASGNPVGSVQFVAAGNTLGTASLSGGIASITTSALAVGTYPITAVYGGDSSFNGSTSSAISQMVRKGGTSVSVTSLNNPSTFGQAVTLKATVSVVAPASGNPTGSISFFSNGITIGSANLSGGIASLSVPTLLVGADSITAFFPGDSSFNESTSTAFNQTVNKIGTTTTLTSSPNPADGIHVVTFTAQVFTASSGGGGPTGTVTFNINGLKATSSVNPATGIASIILKGSSIPYNDSGQAPCTADYSGNSVLSSSVSAVYIQKLAFVVL